ncbi:MAG TPA: hypothetical protein VH650_05415 [Gaiellaceae bacterium]|jgi:hypothetical protein
MLRRRHVSWLVRVGVPLVVGAAAAYGVLSISRVDAAPPVEEGMSPPAFTEATGIEILRVAITAGGGALDVRYRVRDGVKALTHQGGGHGVAVVSESGDVLQTHAFHFGRPPALKTGHTYYELLVNQGGAVEQGDHVTVLHGAARLPDVVVR